MWYKVYTVRIYNILNQSKFNYLMAFNMIKFCILYIIWTMGDNLHVGCLHSSTIWTVNEKTASPIAILVQGCAYKSQITAHGIITVHKYSWSVILVVLLESLFHCHAKVGNISLVRIVYSFKKKKPSQHPTSPFVNFAAIVTDKLGFFDHIISTTRIWSTAQILICSNHLFNATLYLLITFYRLYILYEAFKIWLLTKFIPYQNVFIRLPVVLRIKPNSSRISQPQWFAHVMLGLQDIFQGHNTDACHVDSEIPHERKYTWNFIYEIWIISNI